MRLSWIAQAPFWSDEYFSWRTATEPSFIGFLLRVSGVDIYPPLSYLAPWALARWDDALWLLRLPSALAGLACVWVAARWAARMAGGRAGILAAALCAALPLGVYYGWEAKAYGFFALFNLLCLEEAWRLGAEPDRNPRWFLIFAACASYSFWFSPYYFAVVFLYAASVSSIVRTKVSRALGWSLILALPLAPFFIKTLLLYKADAAVQSIAGSCLSIANFGAGFWAPWTLAAAMAAVQLALFFGLLFGPRPRRAMTLLALAIFLPLLLGMGLSALGRPGLSDRAMLASAYALAVASALALDRLSPRFAAVLLLLLVVGQTYSVQLYTRDAGLQRADWSEIYGYLQERAEPGDAFVHTHFVSALPFQYYTDRDGRQGRRVHLNLVPLSEPPSFDPKGQGLRDLWRRMKPWLKAQGWGVDAGLDPVFAYGQRMQDLLKPHRRLWVLRPYPSALRKQHAPTMGTRLQREDPPTALDEVASQSVTKGWLHKAFYRFRDAQVDLYERPERGT